MASLPGIRQPRCGGVIDLGDEDARAEAVANGVIWSAPMAAQVQAVRDMATGRTARPAIMPDWAANTLDYFRAHPEENPDAWQ